MAKEDTDVIVIGAGNAALCAALAATDSGASVVVLEAAPEIESGAFYPMGTGHADGTGLGLSIAQQLIQSHGGTINYERKGNITCFSILFPIEHDNAK